MVVGFSALLYPQSLHVGLDDDVHKTFHKIEDKSGINHLDIGSLGQVVIFVVGV